MLPSPFLFLFPFLFPTPFLQDMGITDARDIHQIKQLIQMDPWMLASLIIVSVLHTVFNFLAFKNDVTFWRGKRSVKGQSLTSLYMRAGMQTVILLYLLDSAGTSRLIIGNFAVGVVIEFWKIWKAHSIQMTATTPDTPETTETPTEEEPIDIDRTSAAADKQAAHYLFLLLMPLLVAYSIYSLVNDEHKSVYSFVLGTLVRFIYWFGFVMMTPQLFVNYKLKSVAHMPMRAFTYKALGTFIDDIFAFAMEMPNAHRLACLRDDFIFLVYVYQYYIYGVDHSRVNEYGQWALLGFSLEGLRKEKATLEAAISTQTETEKQESLKKLALIEKAITEKIEQEEKEVAMEQTIEDKKEEEKEEEVVVEDEKVEEAQPEKVVDRAASPDLSSSGSEDEDDEDEGFVKINSFRMS